MTVSVFMVSPLLFSSKKVWPPNSLCYAHTGYAGAGVDAAREQRKLEARKMLENAAESLASSVSMHAVLGVFELEVSLAEKNMLFHISHLSCLFSKTVTAISKSLE